MNRLFRDRNGKVVIWQLPNAPLWIWIISTGVGWWLHGGPKLVVGIIGSLALAIWAILELGWGSTLFRRILGVVVLVAVISKAIFRQ